MRPHSVKGAPAAYQSTGAETDGEIFTGMAFLQKQESRNCSVLSGFRLSASLRPDPVRPAAP